MAVVQFETVKVSSIVHMICGGDKKVMMSSTCFKLNFKRKSMLRHILMEKHLKILRGLFKNLLHTIEDITWRKSG